MSQLNIEKMQKIMAHPRVMLQLNMLTAIFDIENKKLYISCGRYKAATGPYRQIDILKNE